MNYEEIYKVLQNNCPGVEPDALILLAEFLAARNISISKTDFCSINDPSSGRINIGNHHDSTFYGIDIGSEKVFINKKSDYTFTIETKNEFADTSIVYGIHRDIHKDATIEEYAFAEILSGNELTLISYLPEYNSYKFLIPNQQVLYKEVFSREDIERVQNVKKGDVGLYKTGDVQKSYANALDELEISPTSTSEMVLDGSRYENPNNVDLRLLTSLDEMRKEYDNKVRENLNRQEDSEELNVPFRR